MTDNGTGVATASSDEGGIDIGLPRSEQVGMAVLGGVVGLGLCWALPWLISLAGSLEWFPFQGQLRLVGRLSGELPVVRLITWIVLPVAGVVAGLALAAMSTTIRINANEIVVRKDNRNHRVARPQVERIILVGKELSIRDDRDADLVSAKLDAPINAVVRALRTYGWSVERTEPR